MEVDMKTSGFSKEADWENIIVAADKEHPDLLAVSVADLAAARKKSPYDAIFDVLLEVKLQAGMMLFMMSEDNVRMQLRYPRMMIGTDGAGSIAEGHEDELDAHPRQYGTFPAVLGRYVREQKVLTLEDAVHRMTGLPAERLAWKDRGLLKKGFAADIVVFNPDTVIDRATYKKPNQYPAGIPHVIVNGQFVVRDGKHTKALPGKILR
jgi:N-acyl-D-aspartate/D-glutamate deacylase